MFIETRKRGDCQQWEELRKPPEVDLNQGHVIHCQNGLNNLATIWMVSPHSISGFLPERLIVFLAEGRGAPLFFCLSSGSRKN